MTEEGGCGMGGTVHSGLGGLLCGVSGVAGRLFDRIGGHDGMEDPERGECDQIRHDGRSAFFPTAMPLVLIVFKTMPLLRLDPLFFCNHPRRRLTGTDLCSFRFLLLDATRDQRWLRDGLTLT